MNYQTVLTLFSTVLCSAAAMATTMIYDVSGDSNQPEEIYLTDNAFRAGGTGGDWMLFDRSSKTMFIVNDEKGEYYVMDQAQMDALGQTLGNVNKQIEEALAQVPESQRAQVRAMMESMMPGNAAGAAPPVADDINVNFTGRNDRVAGIECEIVETSINAEPESELCLAKPGALELTSGEQATLRAMAEFAEDMISTMKQHAGNLIPADFSADSIVRVLENGVPIRMHDKRNDDLSQLESISHDAIDPELVRVPAGYQRKSFGLGQ